MYSGVLLNLYTWERLCCNDDVVVVVDVDIEVTVVVVVVNKAKSTCVGLVT